MILLVSNFVRSEALMISDLRGRRRRARGDVRRGLMASHERTLKRLVDPERHPGIARQLETGVMSEPDDPEYQFTFGMEVLLGGVEALIRKAAGGAGGPEDRGDGAKSA
ncbi:hypothetical protein SCALM49S_08921 [Streptomyces californicus]